MALVHFLLTAVAMAFVTALLLATYEGTKKGGFDPKHGRTIAWFSIITGLLIAAVRFGMMPANTGGPFVP